MMCGRYTLTINTDELSERFGCVVIEKIGGPRYNIAPLQRAPRDNLLSRRNADAADAMGTGALLGQRPYPWKQTY